MATALLPLPRVCSLADKGGSFSSSLFHPLSSSVAFSSQPFLRRERLSLRNARPFTVKAMAPPKPGGKAKKVVGVVKLALEAGKATPAPPVGPALGSKGVNIMAFCKEYNAKTAEKAAMRVELRFCGQDKSFTFVLKTPPASVLLLKAAEGGESDHRPVKAIATEKLPDLNCTTLESAMRIIAGTAANMGIDVDPPILEPKKKVVL
ncbi:unnamed protein product [Spirodela intermedia]|uniref:Uncharacterized protein n=1 Tax=Spirodela intermedia TaxID=51605 RepID=A0A7I8JTQ9_SPIIN|nr:unnamed protein product [Spirodela intermedia]CAA6673558.1 unnamed protein product [Spirodela intermedia]